MINETQLKLITKRDSSICNLYVPKLNEIFVKYKINTSLRVSHFLAQILHESGNLHYLEENLNYSAKGLLATFPKKFKDKFEAERYERKPEKIANKVYAGIGGNGDEASGDGWRYRGRGLIQLTTKNNYIAFSKDHIMDVVNYPDQLSSTHLAATPAGWYWNKNDLNLFADKDDITTITKRINGGYNGIEDRKVWLEKCKRVFL